MASVFLIVGIFQELQDGIEKEVKILDVEGDAALLVKQQHGYCSMRGRVVWHGQPF